MGKQRHDIGQQKRSKPKPPTKPQGTEWMATRLVEREVKDPIILTNKHEAKEEGS